MGGKTKINRSTSNNAVIAHRKRTLSDITEFEVAIYAPVLLDCKQIGAETIIGLDSLDELIETSTTVTKLHHIIRIRIIEMEIQRRFEGPLFEFGRVPKVRRLSKAKTTCPPTATTTRLVKETKKNAHMSIGAQYKIRGICFGAANTKSVG